MVSKTCRRLAYVCLFILVLNGVLALLTNVPTHVTESDGAVFRTTLGLTQIERPLTYAQELNVIRQVQRLVMEKAPMGEPISEYESREPEDLFRKRSGLCYDRSRTFDKVYAWLGFKTRHVYIFYPVDDEGGKEASFLKTFFTRASDSHAVTEVKTSKGWLVVDSNSSWISVTKDGQPVDADHLKNHVNDFEDLPSYFNQDFWAVRGLYSRRGQFYRPYIPYPQLNWVDFGAWLVNID